MRIILSALAAIILLHGNQGSAQTVNFREYAFGVIQRVNEGIKSCGMQTKLAPANTPTPADYLVFSANGRLVAHVLDQGFHFAVKHPNGGYVHWLDYSVEYFGAYLPDQGKIAGGNRFATPAGYGANLYCRSRPVTAAGFDACVQRGFIDVLVNRLCRS
jgi:hypothetical protein